MRNKPKQRTVKHKDAKTSNKPLTKGQEIVEKMKGKATIKLSAEEILKMTRGR